MADHVLNAVAADVTARRASVGEAEETFQMGVLVSGEMTGKVVGEWWEVLFMREGIVGMEEVGSEESGGDIFQISNIEIS